MVSTGSVATNRKFTGTACLYRHLALRKPPFLRRNLDVILDRHEKSLAASRKRASGGLELERGEVNGMAMAALANEERESGWDYPTMEIMEGLLRGRKPVLRLGGLRVRREGGAGVQR